MGCGASGGAPGGVAGGYAAKPGQCRTPGCPYKLNENPGYRKSKSEIDHHYCCTMCRTTGCKGHGSWCQKIPHAGGSAGPAKPPIPARVVPAKPTVPASAGPAKAPIPAVAANRESYRELISTADPPVVPGSGLISDNRRESSAHTVYREAQDMICLASGWMQHTRHLRFLQLFDGLLKSSPELNAYCRDKSCTAKTVTFCRSMASTQDITGFCNGFGNADHQAHLALACVIMAAHETPDGIMAVFERVADRQGRCESARKQGYNIMVQTSALLLENQQLQATAAAEAIEEEQPDLQHGVSTKSLSGERGAKQRIYECVEEYLDQHKEQAFFSAIHEPTRFIHFLNRNNHGITHVEVHALNGFLTMLRGGLGVQLPRIPLDDDPHWAQASLGCWDANFLNDKAWQAFSKPEHFGLSVEGIKELKDANKEAYLGSQASSRGLGPPREIERRARDGDASLAVYMNKYAYFFRREFLVKRMFEVLHSESKPEHMGFKKAIHTIFGKYREEKGIEAESYVEHFYDEYIMNLDTDAVANMFAWLGIVKEYSKSE